MMFVLGIQDWSKSDEVMCTVLPVGGTLQPDKGTFALSVPLAW